MERFAAELEGRLMMINSKIDKVQTWEYIDLIMQERIKELNDDLSKRIKTLSSKVEKQIQDIYSEHLTKEGVIGPEEGCNYATLMQYACEKIPSIDKKVKKAIEDIS